MQAWGELWDILCIRKMFCNHLPLRTIDLCVSHKQAFLNHCHNKWKYESYCWHFCLNLKCLEWPYREYVITAKKSCFCGELLSENDFKVVLATSCCNDDGANISEAVQKIATDQKDLHKCSSCVIVWWIAKIYQSMSVKKG